MKWILFISLTDICYWWITKNFTITSLLQWLNQCFYSTDTSCLPMLPILPASMWFMPMFISVELIGSSLLSIWHKFNIDDMQLIYVILFLIVGLSYLSLNNGNTWFLLPQDVCFYGIMYLIGYLSYKFVRAKKRYYAAAIALDALIWFVLSRLYGVSPTNLVDAKFPPHIMYLAASMISVIVCMMLYGRIDFIVEKAKVIRYIGRNSLSYYFSQGIACSIPYVYICINQQIIQKYSWKLLLLGAFMFNIFVGITIGSLFSYLLLVIKKLILLRKRCNQ